MVNCIWPLMICVSVGHIPLDTPANLCIGKHDHESPRLCKIVITLSDVFSYVDRPRPSQDVTDLYITMVFRNIQLHVVKLGHTLFYVNYVCMCVIDIDQLKGNPKPSLLRYRY